MTLENGDDLTDSETLVIDPSASSSISAMDVDIESANALDGENWEFEIKGVNDGSGSGPGGG